MPTNEEEDDNVYRGGEEEDEDGFEDEDEDEEEDIETDDEDEEEEDQDINMTTTTTQNQIQPEEEEEEEDHNSESPCTSSQNQAQTLSTNTQTVTIATPPTTTITNASAATIDSSTVVNGSTFIATTTSTVSELSSDHKQHQTATEEKKPSAIDDSRRLFQRLWTDEDEIGLLQGFLDYTAQRGHNKTFSSSSSSSHHHHHDTGPFYDQIKTRLQLDFNKNQLVEKLRRLKKKYRNVMTRIKSGKDFNFKSPHDQATFEISRKIWGDDRIAVAEAGIDDDEGNPMIQNVDTNNNHISFGNNNNGAVEMNSSEKKVLPRSRKRSRKAVEAEPNLPNLSNIPVALSIPNVIEDTVRSCLSPLFKELLSSTMGGGASNPRVLGGMALSPIPLNLGGNGGCLNLLSGEMVDEKWRKQQILELEVYSKRMELVQDQIKLALEELRSMDHS